MPRAESCRDGRGEWRVEGELRCRDDCSPSEVSARYRGFWWRGRAVVKETAKVREVLEICKDHPALWNTRVAMIVDISSKSDSLGFSASRMGAGSLGLAKWRSQACT